MKIGAFLSMTFLLIFRFAAGGPPPPVPAAARPARSLRACPLARAAGAHDRRPVARRLAPLAKSNDL